MYRGRLCEIGTPSELFAPPYHPYTEALLTAVPVVQTGIRQRRIELPRAAPDTAAGPLPACPFAGRCPHQVGPVCIEEPPPDRSTRPGRHLFCHLPPDRLDAMEPVFVRSSS